MVWSRGENGLVPYGNPINIEGLPSDCYGTEGICVQIYHVFALIIYLLGSRGLQYVYYYYLS